jgi:hypothetical protein
MFWRRKQISTEPASLTPVASPVSDALILICEKCGNKLCRAPGENPAREIAQRLKQDIRALGDKRKVGCVLASCIDVCPEREIAVAISRMAGANEFLSCTGRPQEAARLILGKLRREAV